MRVLVGCEFSNTVASMFRCYGHEAWSCDILPSEGPSEWHIQGDVFDAISIGTPGHGGNDWDLVILHPPCTALCVAGNRHYSGTQERTDAIRWTLDLWNLAKTFAGRVALENPVGVLSSNWRPPNQYIQPWQFGHGETKKTGLWLHNLPPLEPSNIVDGREQRIWKMPPSADRWKIRSETYTGIANAMADQWGDL